jgi:anti-sigma factor RsiW
MNHLTEDRLSAYVDGALTPAEHAAADAHLAGCEACRATLVSMRAADALFGEVLAHDPGDAYFRTFAARVADRIAEEGAARPAAAAAREAAAEIKGAALVDALPPARPARQGAPWWDIGSWFRSPARLAWVGGVAAVVVAAGVALMIARESGVPGLRDAKLLDRGAQTEARGPAPEAAAPPAAALESEAARADAQMKTGKDERANAGGAESDAAARQATPARLREMRQTPGGEDVPVGRQDAPAFAREPAPAPAPVAPGEPVKVRRPQRAEPLAASEKAQAPAPAPAPTAASETTTARRAASNLDASGAREGESAAPADRLRLDATISCGVVVDARGRPIARAQVVLGDRGVTATTGEEGRFCFDVAAGEYDLTVLAVGFTPLRQRVALGDPKAPARLVAQTVDVLAPRATAAQPAPASPTYGFRQGLPSAPAAPAGLPVALRPRWEEAGRLMADAARERSARRYEASALVWNELVARIVPEGPRLDAREHRAEALYAAWELEPSGGRAAAAAAALRELIEHAPEGPRRDRAREMLARLQP